MTQYSRNFSSDLVNFNYKEASPYTGTSLETYENVEVSSSNTEQLPENEAAGLLLKENYTVKDMDYNSKADYRAPTFNEWTRIYDDGCNEANRLKIGSKPMKYYVNQYNSPQTQPFFDFTVIGNQKTYNIPNEFSYPVPTRLNPLYPVNTEPYATSPNLGQTSENRMYSDTGSILRFGTSVRDLKSTVNLSEKDYNRFDPSVGSETVQNAGQYSNISKNLKNDGYYDYFAPNHISMGNDAVPYYGISTRNLLQNAGELSNC